MKSILSLKKVTKRYGDKAALSGVSLELVRGEILGILGPSGAGKTTMLRLMGLLDVPTEGKVLFRGKSVTPDEDRALEVRRKMAMILQKPVVFRGTVAQNAAYGLNARKVEKSASRGRTLKALAQVGLEGVADRPAYTLSGGEVQRLAFARATVLEPELLLLDEFTANLDPANVSIIEELVNDYSEKGGTVAMITHNLQQGRRLTDRICLLLGGKLLALEETERFFSSPATEKVRDFLSGKMVW